MSLAEQIKQNTEDLKKSSMIDFKNLKYKTILNRVEQLEFEIKDLTKSFQLEFNKINEFMGCLCAKLEEVSSQLKSIQNSAKNRSS